MNRAFVGLMGNKKWLTTPESAKLMESAAEALLDFARTAPTLPTYRRNKWGDLHGGSVTSGPNER